ncbi:MAG: ribosome maturation factor RimM [Oscillospiraceae bacterium]|jgi:16S rRNA processing protein RimM|nr:ribosome maturation factor RimM [Oscillospiraceae bacterium]
MKNELIETGKIVNSHGRYGEVRIQPWADSPEFLTGFTQYYIDDVPIKVLSAKIHKACVIASLEGVSDINAAIKMKNKIIKIKKDDVKLEDGRYFIADLIGLQAIDAKTGEGLGTVAEVISLPLHDVYVINGQREILVPAVPEFVVEIDLKEGYIKLRLIEDM